MANIYVRSTDGDNASDGLSWANAKATLTGAAAIDAAGDTIFVSQSHAESTNGTVSPAFNGTPTNIVRVLCVDDSAEPPTTLATGATVTNTGNNNMSIAGAHYVYGISFQIGSGSATASFISGGTAEVFENCTWSINNTGLANRVRFGGSAPTTSQRVTLINPSFKFANAAQGLQSFGTLSIFGGQALLGGQNITAFYTIQGAAAATELLVDGFDFSNWGSGLFLLGGTPSASGRAVFRNCKLPPAWTGALYQASPVDSVGYRAEMRNCASGDVNYALWVEDWCGKIRDETTLVKTGGASDGTTALAWKMQSSAQAAYPHAALHSPEIAKWNETIGSAITVTVDILHDSAMNLKDDEIWLEVQYLGTNGFPLSLFSRDFKTSVLAASADQAASSATWTTTGMTNPNKQKLEVTFTPREKGLLIATVHLAKTSYTVYVDPVLQVS